MKVTILREVEIELLALKILEEPLMMSFFAQTDIFIQRFSTFLFILFSDSYVLKYKLFYSARYATKTIHISSIGKQEEVLLYGFTQM